MASAKEIKKTCPPDICASAFHKAYGREEGSVTQHAIFSVSQTLHDARTNILPTMKHGA